MKSFVSKKLRGSHDFSKLPDRVVIYGKVFSKTSCDSYWMKLKHSFTCYISDDAFR